MTTATQPFIKRQALQELHQAFLLDTTDYETSIITMDAIMSKSGILFKTLGEIEEYVFLKDISNIRDSFYYFLNSEASRHFPIFVAKCEAFLKFGEQI